METLESICQRLGSNAADLTILNLNYRGIGNRGASLLGRALRTNRSLVVLFLDGNDISGPGAKELSSAMLGHPSLKQLYMSYNPIGDEGAKAIAQSLHGTKLRVLKLADCRIGVPGATAFAHALRDNPTLRKLSLDTNPRVGAQGSIALAKSLQTNDALAHLDLQDCVPNFYDGSSLGLQVQQAFRDTLRVNKSLRELLLQDACLLEQASEAPTFLSHLERHIQHLLDLNRLGRRGLHLPTIPKQALPRLLASASAFEGKGKHGRSTALIYSILLMRPDLLPWERQESPA